MGSNFEPTLQEIATALGGDLFCGGFSSDTPIERIASLGEANASAISFLSSAKYAKELATTCAACVILTPAQFEALDKQSQRFACIVTADPYLYYAKLSQWWRAKQSVDENATRIHPSAVIGQNVTLGKDVRIGALSVIEDGVSIGENTRIAARVTVGAACHIGARCIVHSGAVIGADGFGFAPDKATGAWVKIEQLGAVRIGDDVEIGANTCIDRGALSDTVIEDGVKLDNLIQIGHNVHIGKHTAMAGCVGVAGSAKIGAHCTVGGGAVVLGHLELADHVHISAASVVMRSIKQAGNYTGIFPIDENKEWEKNAVTVRQLSSLRDRLRALEKN